ncbi:MAG: ATP-binding protein [Myxococcota bacterium]|nr:ATP-binding protein [Myxococcota bacterium]
MFRPSQDPWTESRLTELGPYEHDFQEFKGARYLFDGEQIAPSFQYGLSKQLSAFANGAGGRVVIGLDDEGRIDGGVPVLLRPNGTREWLEDIIPGLLSPKLSRFNVFEVRGSGAAGSALAADHGVYVIEVPPSDEAPHQALDLRYYLRIAGKSRPMGHVHIQDVLRRTRHPEVDLARLGPYGEPELDRSDRRGPRALISFRAFLRNDGRSLAQHVGAEMIVPRPLLGKEVRRRNLELPDVHYTQTPGEVAFFRYHPVPLFPTQEVFFLRIWVRLHTGNMDAIRAGAGLSWKVYADDAPPRTGELPLATFGVVGRCLRWIEEEGKRGS